MMSRFALGKADSKATSANGAGIGTTADIITFTQWCLTKTVGEHILNRRDADNYPHNKGSFWNVIATQEEAIKRRSDDIADNRETFQTKIRWF